MLRATGRREHPHCFACSDPAAGGLGLQFNLLPDASVMAEWSCPAAAESYPGVVHGGIVATLLDAAMVHALFARAIVARTAELRVRFRNPMLVGIPVTVRAWLCVAKNPLFELAAEVRQGGSLGATATAKFMRIAATVNQAAGPA